MHQYLNHKNYVTLAHRGGSLETHENTLEGFSYAVKIGCNYMSIICTLLKTKHR